MSEDETRELHDLLIRIDERVKSVQKEIFSINADRRCHTHTEKIRNLEKLAWASLSMVVGVIGRLTYEAFK